VYSNRSRITRSDKNELWEFPSAFKPIKQRRQEDDDIFKQFTRICLTKRNRRRQNASSLDWELSETVMNQNSDSDKTRSEGSLEDVM